MTFLVADRVQETTTTTGTGSVALGGAVEAYVSFASAIGSGNTTYYCLLDANGTAWEIGSGVVSGSGPYTLARSAVLSSSSGSAPISLSTGTHHVFVPAPTTMLQPLATLAATGTFPAAAINVTGALTVGGTATTGAISATSGSVGGNLSAGTLNVTTNGTFGGALSLGGFDTNGAQLRLTQGSYGAMLRNDGTSLWLLLTADGDPNGSWNGLRPLTLDLSSGGLTLDGTGAGVSFGGNVNAHSLSATSGTLSDMALAGTVTGNPSYVSLSLTDAWTAFCVASPNVGTMGPATLTTNAATAPGSNTLYFATTSALQTGMFLRSTGVIGDDTYITSLTGSTAVLNHAVNGTIAAATAVSFVNQSVQAQLRSQNANQSILRFLDWRNTTNGGWSSASKRIQMRTDITDQGFIEFNPPSTENGVALGAGTPWNSTYGLYVSGNGQVTLPYTLSANIGSFSGAVTVGATLTSGTTLLAVGSPVGGNTAAIYLNAPSGYTPWLLQLDVNGAKVTHIDAAGNLTTAGALNSTSGSISGALVAGPNSRISLAGNGNGLRIGTNTTAGNSALWVDLPSTYTDWPFTASIGGTNLTYIDSSGNFHTVGEITGASGSISGLLSAGSVYAQAQYQLGTSSFLGIGSDGASPTNNNTYLSSWWSIGFRPSCPGGLSLGRNMAGVFINTRAANITALGGATFDNTVTAGPTRISTTNGTTTIDTGGYTPSLSSIVDGGANVSSGDWYYDSYWNQYNVTNASNGIATALSLTLAHNQFSAPPAGTTAITLYPADPATTGSNVAVNLNWTQARTLSLNPSGTSVTVPTPTTTDNSTNVATTAYVQNQGYLTGNQTITLSGDASGAGATAIAVTLANTGVATGTYTKLTVNAKGLITAGASLASGDVTGALGYTPVNKAGDTMTGALTATGLTSTGAIDAASGSITGTLTISGTLATNAGSFTSLTASAATVTGSLTSTATGATTARNLADRFADRLNVKDFGAVGDGTTDDTAAFAACINKAISLMNAGGRPVVYLPAATYYINGATLPTFSYVPGSIVGDGPHHTVIKLGSAYSGDLFSWSECWMYNSYGTNTVTATDQAGVVVSGFSVIGVNNTANTQNGLVFYDRNDMVLIRDVHLFYLSGHAFYAGYLNKNLTGGHTWMRESKIFNLLAWGCGAAGIPSVELASHGLSGEDDTNEVSFYALDIQAPVGPGLVVRNAGAQGLRLVRFFGLRVEGAGGSPPAGDLVTIGDTSATYAGNINNIHIYGFEGNGGASGYATLRFTANSSSVQPYNCSVQGTITTGSGDGVHIDAGRQIDLRLADCHVSGTAITVGANGLVSPVIRIDGNGAETSWTYNIDATSIDSVVTPSLPLAGNPSGTGRQVFGTLAASALATGSIGITQTIATGNWSGFNFSSGAMIKGTGVNPALGFEDVSGSYYGAIAQTPSGLGFMAMPAPTNGSTPPNILLTLSPSGGTFTVPVVATAGTFSGNMTVKGTLVAGPGGTTTTGSTEQVAAQNGSYKTALIAAAGLWNYNSLVANYDDVVVAMGPVGSTALTLVPYASGTIGVRLPGTGNAVLSGQSGVNIQQNGTNVAQLSTANVSLGAPLIAPSGSITGTLAVGALVINGSQPVAITASWGSGNALTAGTYILQYSAPYPWTITTMDYSAGTGGTFSLAIYNGGTPIGGLSVTASSASKTTATAISNLGAGISASATISLVISGITGTPEGAAVSLNGTKATNAVTQSGQPVALSTGWGSGNALTAGTYILQYSAPYPWTITTMDYSAGTGGTFSLAVYNGGSAIGGLSVTASSATKTTARAAADLGANIAASATISLVISGISGTPQGAVVGLNGTKS